MIDFAVPIIMVMVGLGGAVLLLYKWNKEEP
jgi:hypothetical protein